MKKKTLKTIIAISILLILGPMVYFGIIKPKSTKAAWWDDRWAYRQAVNITNGSGSALTDFQVNINIGTSALIAAGKMQSNCNDVRVTDVNGKSLSYWAEEAGVYNCNSSGNSTYVWAKVPSIPTSGATIYIYYGNPSANNAGNGNNVFEFFDDFADGSIDSAKWSQGTIAATSGTNFSESGGNLTGGNTNRYIQSVASFTGNYSVITRVCEGALAANGWSSAGFYGSSSNSYGILVHSGNVYFRNNSSWIGPSTFAGWQCNRSVATVVGTAASGSIVGETSNTVTDSSTNTGGISSEYVRLSARYDDSATDQNYTANWSWIFVKKAVATSPTTSNSSEETGPPVAYWKFDEGYGTTANDSASNNNGSFGASAAAPTWKTEDMCVSGKCLYFDGGDNISINSTIGNFGTSDFSVSGWLKTNSTTASYLLTKRTACGHESFWSISLHAAGLINAEVDQDGAGTNYNTAYSSSSVNDGKWHHFTVIRSGAVIYFYIDGKLDATDVGPGTANLSSSSTTKIGLSPCSGQFLGNLDDLKIYPYARTLAQIKTDYNAGKGHLGSSEGTSANLGSNKDSSDALSSGLTAYFKLDENTGTYSTESTGTGVTATLTNGAAWASGKFGSGNSFDGINDYTDAGNNFNIGTGDFSISAWFNTNTITSGTAQMITDKGYIDTTCTTDGNQAYGIRLTSGNVINLKLNTGSSQGCFSLNGNLSVGTTATWHHTVATVDRDGNATLYLNGVQDNSSSVAAYSNTLNNALTFRFGSSSSNAGGTYLPFNGKIDEVRVYNRVLSPAEVSYLYNWAPGPVGYWKMEEGSGSTAYDSSGIGNSGTATGSTIVTGKYGKARNLDGDDYINVGSPSSFNVGNYLTIAGWVKITAMATRHGIFTTRSANSAGSFQLEVGTGNGGTNRISVTSPGIWNLETNSNVITTGTWYHIAFIKNGAGSQSLYLNGVKQTLLTDNPQTFADNADNKEIGRGTSGSQWFNGLIDEMKVYNYPRTQKQIVEDMNAGHPGVKTPVAHWKMEEPLWNGTSGEVKDSSGYGKNGTSVSGAHTGDGRFGKGGDFSHSSDYVDIGDKMIQPNHFTISLWVKPDSSCMAPTQGCGILGNAQYSGSGGHGYHMGFYSDNKFYFYIEEGSTCGSTVDTSNFSANTWTHVTAVYDGATYIYINGIRKDGPDICSKPTDATFNLRLGYDPQGGWSNPSFNGFLDEVKIYSYALTTEEIKMEYNLGSAIVLGSTSVNTGNTNPASASSQEYCIPGDTSTCSPPVAEWKMEEGSGTVLYDSTGAGNTGAITSATWKTGKIGTALYFDGTDDTVSITDPGTNSIFDFGSGESITLEAWVKPSLIDANYRTIIGKRVSGNFNNYSIRKETSNDGILSFFYRNSANTAWHVWATTSSVLSANSWTHIALTYTFGTGSSIKLYANGVSATGSWTSGNGDDAPYEDDSALQIGNNNGQRFNGLIDQVRIFNYARSPAQVAWDYNRGAPVGHWKFDECQGSTVYDSSGIGNTGAITVGASGSQNLIGTCNLGTGSSAAWGNGATGKFNSSLNFDGTDDKIDTSTPLNWTSTTPFSFGGWFYLNNTTTGYMLATSNTVGAGALLASISKDGYISGKVSMIVGKSGTGQTNINSSVSYQTGNWEHYMAVYDGANNMYLYRNGLLVASGTYSNGAATSCGSGFYMMYANNSTNYVNGQIDDVRVYNYALNATQIKDVYNQGSAVRFGPSTGSP